MTWIERIFMFLLFSVDSVLSVYEMIIASADR